MKTGKLRQIEAARKEKRQRRKAKKGKRK